MKSASRNRLLQSSTIALSIMFAQAANAQTPPADATIASQEDGDIGADIIVTGTSLRGVAPVGSNLISVGRAAIDQTSAQTIQQILKTVPAITAAANAGQGPAGTSYYSPTIHSLGSSASNSTLVLIDGHRFSLGGQPHPLSDPNIIPPIALERVEVIAEGASSIYGSDAVAGVINFITRRNYDGFEVTGQIGFGNDYRTYNAGALWGTKWDTGSVMLAYNYSNRSALSYADRDFLRPDHRAQGGTNFSSFNCSPAWIQPGASGPIFKAPGYTESAANSAENAECDNTIYGDLLPREVRHNVMAKISQDFGDNLTAGVDFVYSNRQNHQRAGRGNLTARAFRTGDRANPFYVNPPSIAPGTPAGDEQQVRWNAEELLGPGAYNDNGSVNYYVSGNLEYRLGDNFRITALALTGRDDHDTESDGQLCGSCANLALNGTTNTGGNITQPSIPGTDIIILGYPLTPANALDVWNTGSANRTSQAVRDMLTDSRAVATYNHSITQARLGIDGTLFELPGGEVQIAVGGEYLEYGLDIQRSRPNNTGPASSGSEQLNLNLGRHVKSVYGELQIPIVGSGNEMPFIHSLELNLSGRYDDYSDVGSTANPKIAASWEIVEGVKLRGNWSKSFVAPAISSIGDASREGLASFSGYGPGETILVPKDNYPLAALLPDCGDPNEPNCQLGGSVVPGISYNNGNPDLKPQKGSGWSIGLDLAPVALTGFRMGVTLFTAKFRGGVTSPNLATVINTPGLNHLLTIYPDGATPEQIRAVVGQAPLNSPIQDTIYWIRNGRQQNVVNLDIQGLDVDAGYRLQTDSAGIFTVGGSVSRFLKFDQNIGGGPTFSVLNSTGFNETFPSIKTQARANIGWEYESIAATLFANYIGGYRNWSSTTVDALERDENGNPAGGGDKVDGSTLFDLNLTYTMPDSGVLGGSQVFIDVVNLFDREPSFYNSANGYDNYGANPIGRVVTLGFRAKL